MGRTTFAIIKFMSQYQNKKYCFCIYWVDAKVSADFLKNVFKRCSATMDAWFSCI